MLAPACAILEAILFASGDPIPLSRLAAASDIPERELPQLLNDLNTAYQKSGHALQVLLLEKTAQLCTVERYAPYIQAALEQKRSHAGQDEGLTEGGKPRSGQGAEQHTTQQRRLQHPR